jgi:hypothetical protein
MRPGPYGHVTEFIDRAAAFLGLSSQMVRDGEDEEEGHGALFAAVIHLLRPLVRILLNHGVPFETFAELARGAYVDVAHREFAIPGKKQTDSRVSVLTGLTRKEVARLRELERPEDAASASSYNRAARVVSAWVREHPSEGTASGAAVLPLDGPRSLSELIRRHSGDMPVRAVIDELLRVDAIRLRESGEVELLQRHYLPRGGERRKLVYLGHDVADLIATIGHNIDARPGKGFFQRKVFYDNIPVEHLAKVRDVARKHGEAAIDALVHAMGAHDRDANPRAQGSGRMRAMVGIYYHEAVFSDEDAASHERRKRAPGTEETSDTRRTTPPEVTET